jgi:hypothetical protein
LDSYINSSKFAEDADTVIFALGIHNAEEIYPHHKHIREKNVEHLNEWSQLKFDSRIAQICAQTHIPWMIWRTSPPAFFPDLNQTFHLEVVLSHFNKEVQRAIGQTESCRGRLVVVDGQKLLGPVSMGEERIEGDSEEHFGEVARVAQIQTIVHKLATLKQLDLDNKLIKLKQIEKIEEKREEIEYLRKAKQEINNVSNGDDTVFITGYKNISGIDAESAANKSVRLLL